MITYISLDIEADGPCPGINSMLQLGAAAFDESGIMLDSVVYNLDTLPDAKSDPKTMAWWMGDNKAAYEKTRKSILPAKEAMQRFSGWVRKYPRPTGLCYPAGFDFSWVYWYCHKFLGDSPFGFQALDIKSYAAAVLQVPYRDATKKNMPREWFQGLPKHTHDGRDDAIEQGILFFKILESVRKTN